jgi:HEAT repeat protein
VLSGYADGAGLPDALIDPDPEVRLRAMGAAERLGVLTTDQRVAALRDPSALVRRRACSIETRRPSGAPQVAGALVACLGDDDPLVVVGAATALGEATAADAVDGLGAVAVDHRDARCREAAIAALGAIGEPHGLAAVLQGLSDKPAVRRRAVVALAAFTGDDVDAALATAATDRDWQVREVATALLEVSRDDAGAPPAT